MIRLNILIVYHHCSSLFYNNTDILCILLRNSILQLSAKIQKTQTILMYYNIETNSSQTTDNIALISHLIPVKMSDVLVMLVESA